MKHRAIAGLRGVATSVAPQQEAAPCPSAPFSKPVAPSQRWRGQACNLHRAFGFRDPTELDPFLLFDDFRNDDPMFYKDGFPWHPHRGIETITYVLRVRWTMPTASETPGASGRGRCNGLTAGSGILHQEMPLGNARGRMHGFQLWGNLPGAQKDDRAALPGHRGRRHPRGDRWTTAPMCA